MLSGVEVWSCTNFPLTKFVCHMLVLSWVSSQLRATFTQRIDSGGAVLRPDALSTGGWGGQSPSFQGLGRCFEGSLAARAHRALRALGLVKALRSPRAPVPRAPSWFPWLPKTTQGHPRPPKASQCHPRLPKAIQGNPRPPKATQLKASQGHPRPP